MALVPVKTCEEQCSGIEPAGRALQVMCGQNRAEFHVHKMRLTGKSVGKCVLFEAKWVTPTEFENMSGVHPTKKWRKNIKYKGQPIADWLAKINVIIVSTHSRIARTPKTKSTHNTHSWNKHLEKKTMKTMTSY